MIYQRISKFFSEFKVDRLLLIKYKIRYVFLYLSIVLFAISFAFVQRDINSLLLVSSIVSIAIWIILKIIIDYSEIIILYEEFDYDKGIELLEKKKKHVDKNFVKTLEYATKIYKSEYSFFKGDFEESYNHLLEVKSEELNLSKKGIFDKYFFLKFINLLYMEKIEDASFIIKEYDDFSSHMENNSSYLISVDDLRVIYNLIVFNKTNDSFGRRDFAIKPYNMFFNMYLALINAKLNGENEEKIEMLTKELEKQDKRFFFVDEKKM